MKKAKILLSDFDGTFLPGTTAGILKIQGVLKKMRLPAADGELIRKHWGERFDKLSRLICESVGATEEQIQRFQEIERDFPIAHYFNLRILYKLQRLRYLGYFLALATSRDRQSLQMICQMVGCDLHVFNCVQAAEDSEFHKPDGRVFDKIIAKAAHEGYAPNNLVYMGDTVTYDLAAARNSQYPIQFVAVVSGANTRQEFRQAGVPKKNIIRDVNHIPDFLENRFLRHRDSPKIRFLRYRY